MLLRERGCLFVVLFCFVCFVCFVCLGRLFRSVVVCCLFVCLRSSQCVYFPTSEKKQRRKTKKKEMEGRQRKTEKKKNHDKRGERSVATREVGERVRGVCSCGIF